MVKTYSPKRLILAVNGKQITGFSDTDIVTVELDEEVFVKFKSADGDVSRSHNPTTSGKFTISLNQTSRANQILSALLLADIADNTGRLAFNVSLRDLNSPKLAGVEGTFYIGKNCWIEGMPESTFEKGISTREWVIESSEILFNIAGNDESLFAGIQPGI